ncbi:hypothetical protein B0A48_00688 [Cryoendolithus antarcticus]|uniref:Phospholipase/carboxylesterase/thioesterase domain-containing protein n=1 Tax=Cryoendolithus antarcticus TaxID=1507870 RepID=A0A1V8TV82_9PEZI|nr:hypothetical protein B0A48_00688 [Cryoendolithus antarcticus]
MPGRLPIPADFPSTVKLAILPPPNIDRPTNVLVLLHGLGDGHESFANLGKQMNLPETVCIAIRGPKALLDLEGAHWGDDIIFDSSNGGLDADAGLRESTELIKVLINDMLVEKCGYAHREVTLLGYGQGGMCALSTAIALHQLSNDTTPRELGGIISVGGPLPSEAPAALISKCKTPVIVCGGSSASAITSTAEEKLKRNFEHIEIKRYRRSGDRMPSNRDEMMPIMQFLARRLKSTKGVPEGSIEVA